MPLGPHCSWSKAIFFIGIITFTNQSGTSRRTRHESGRLITTNTMEGFFGLVRRSVFGTYHHWGRGYLQQYLNELDFRYNNRKVNDSERTMLALRATEGKRLTLREPRSASA